MADGEQYAAQFEDEQNNVRLAGRVQFTDDQNQPLPLAGGEVAADVTFSGAIITDLPAVDPTVAGQLWNDAGTVKVSAG